MTDRLPEDPQTAAFELQIDMLKREVDVVNVTIRQMDDISKSLKQWAITVWAAATGGAITTPALRPYVWCTAVIPLLFWLVDSHHHRIQRRFIWRSMAIMDFLNDERLVESFSQRRLVGLAVMDVGSRRDRAAAFAGFVAWRRVFWFRSLSIMYLGLIILSIGLWLLGAVVRVP